MKKITLSIVTLLIIAVLYSFKNISVEDINFADCLKKYNSKWGEPCADCKTWKDSYTVKLRNECNEKIDVQICVQEKNKTWKKFMFTAMPPKDTMTAYACEGTGKYLKWAKKTGDNSYQFPSLDEVNKEYKE
ncbi:MAG: hypothetical protein J0M08_12775 [Bacteroidetes bacterium]|nr:hypothetical protein [Bacteroidota bacterium]